MTDKTLLTIKQNGIHELDIKKSNFICNLRRIKDEDDAKRQLAEITKEHAKATHNCYAYVLGENNEIQRESDNGEPSGTAGVPILEVLKKTEVKNVLAVVTRYFGGIKLGAGGLIRAYSNSASTAIESVGIVQLLDKKVISLTVEYPLFDKLNYYLEENDYPLEGTEYTDKVTVKVAVDDDKVDSFLTTITNLLADKFSSSIGETKIFEVDYHRE